MEAMEVVRPVLVWKTWMKMFYQTKSRQKRERSFEIMHLFILLPGRGSAGVGLF